MIIKEYFKEDLKDTKNENLYFLYELFFKEYFKEMKNEIVFI